MWSGEGGGHEKCFPTRVYPSDVSWDHFSGVSSDGPGGTLLSSSFIILFLNEKEVEGTLLSTESVSTGFTIPGYLDPSKVMRSGSLEERAFSGIFSEGDRR